MPQDEFDRNLIAEYRATGGRVSAFPPGHPLLLLTTLGAKSGQPRTVPLAYTRDGDRLVVIASNDGAPANPAWYHNLIAHPEVTVELGAETYQARAQVVEGAERDRLYAAQAAVLPGFAAYERTTERRIPVVVLERGETSATGAAPAPSSAPG